MCSLVGFSVLERCSVAIPPRHQLAPGRKHFAHFPRHQKNYCLTKDHVQLTSFPSAFHLPQDVHRYLLSRRRCFHATLSPPPRPQPRVRAACASISSKPPMVWERRRRCPCLPRRQSGIWKSWKCYPHSNFWATTCDLLHSSGPSSSSSIRVTTEQLHLACIDTKMLPRDPRITCSYFVSDF